ncbi:FUSC family protein [Streptomyces abyssomicinicus]|uniref:FUSC family protein n=1 Tax=Streptomyces abyssomicinicus TaxID=574929 RepID=UPI00124FFA64
MVLAQKSVTSRWTRWAGWPRKALVPPADPGLIRLRFASRGVLGIAAAVTACGLLGHGIPGMATGGLAALLALFTVTDPTVRGQAATVALQPVVGLPALTVAVLLRGEPVAAGLVFVAIGGLGVYARRWGPRGHTLGAFAFMCYFVAQFTRPTPAMLPSLCADVLIAVAVAAVVRFGLWCYERRFPLPVPPAPPTGGTGLRRITTRQAVQVTAGCLFALPVGHLLSAERWYWAVGATWWIFVNVTSRGETAVRGFRRVLGTCVGALLGLVLTLPLHGAPVPSAVVAAVATFGIFYTAQTSYTWMMLSVTVLAQALYGLAGLLDGGLLVLRTAETLAGAVGAWLAVLLVLPVTTHAFNDAWIRRAVRCVHACTTEAAARLAGDPGADPAPRVAELEALLAQVRKTVAPLVHPLHLGRARRERARRVLVLLDECAREVRALVSVAADPEASHDARLAAACWRVEAAVEALTTPAEGRPPAAGRREPAAEGALAHLHGVERALVALAEPLRVPASDRAPVPARA